MDDVVKQKVGNGWSRFWLKAIADLEARPGYWISLLVILLLTFVIFIWPLRITSQRQLTPLEQTLFQLFLVLLTFLFSWVLAKRTEERNVLANQKSLARSAVRRINGITSSANRLKRSIRRCKDEVAGGAHWTEMEAVRRDLLVELFEGLGSQVEDMTENIAASTEDWRDILPEEFAKREEAERRILHATEVAIDDINKVLAGLREELAKGTVQTGEQISQLKELMGKQIENVENKLSVKVEQIRTDAAGASTAVPYAGSGVLFEPRVKPPFLGISGAESGLFGGLSSSYFDRLAETMGRFQSPLFPPGRTSSKPRSPKPETEASPSPEAPVKKAE